MDCNAGKVSSSIALHVGMFNICITIQLLVEEAKEWYAINPQRVGDSFTRAE